MTTQELLQKIDSSTFTDEAKQEMRALVGDAAEITPEIKGDVLGIMQREIDADLADVPLDPAEAQQIEQDLNTALEEIEREAQANVETVEREVRELADLSQKVDVIERLHS